MASPFSYKVFSVFVFVFSTSHVSYARHPRTQLDLSANMASLQAERLIRSFNLSPKQAVNIPAFDDLEAMNSSAPKIVEKQFQFHVLGKPGPSVQEFGHYAGYYRLRHTKAARMFYFFFESRSNKSSDPVVIWLTGGPGCSSDLALFYENGPFRIANNLSLSWNDFGWDKASNIIFVDQPTGTGFSYTTDSSDVRHDENGVSTDLYDFLQAFFKEHPQLVKNEFYITGESYAGHYIPALASRVHQGNKNKEGIHINLKGFAIGNGLTQPDIQYKAYTDFALENKLIKKSDYDYINKMIPDCEQAIKACGTDGIDTCENALAVCENIFRSILSVAGNINYYDIRKTCDGFLCYNFSNVETFMNQRKVKDALGVENIDFVSCSTIVYDEMRRDFMRNFALGIPALLEDGIRVLVYAGEEDLICNWLGNSRWVNALAWSGKKAFGAAPTVPFVVEGKKAGQLKSHGPLSFLKVHNAGHLVPMDQPKAALQMLKSWLQGKLA